MSGITIALTKGRLQKKAIELFERAGLDASGLREPGRKLILDMPGSGIKVVLAKAPDVITYVEHGVCDIGVVGKDTIMEIGRSFYEVLDLGFGKCRFVLATRNGVDFFSSYKNRRVATKYPNVTRDYFAKKNMDVDIIKIEGSVELAPLLGLSEAIVDIVETGNTLKENGLVVAEEVASISARMIVNLASMKMKKNDIFEFISACEKQLKTNC